MDRERKDREMDRCDGQCGCLGCEDVADQHIAAPVICFECGHSVADKEVVR